MKTIGIIGGLAWPSTIDYYRLLCQKTNEHFRLRGAEPPYPTPHIIIESLNMNETRKLRGAEGNEGSWTRFDDVFRATLGRLEKAGADFAIIASNTPHMRLKAIARGLDFPIVSILSATAEAVSGLGRTRALVLGTSVTMHSTVYSETLKEHGVAVVPRLPDPEIEEIQRLIDVDLYQGEGGNAGERIVQICRRYADDRDQDAICLACTELPLAFPEHRDSADFEVDGFRFVNTTAVHVNAALQEALQ